MAHVEKTVVGLRFFGDAFSPDELTSLLGTEPTSHRLKGHVRTFSSGSQNTANTNSWILHSKLPESEPLAAQIQSLFKATTSDLAAWRDITAKCAGDLFVGLFLGSSNEGLTLDEATLSAISDRHLTLHVDIYGPHEESAD